MYALVFIVAALNPQGEITNLSLWEKPGLTAAACDKLAGVHNTRDPKTGVITEQAWAVCKRGDQA